MSKNQRKTPRKPATKFPHLQKKLQKQKAQVKQRKENRGEAVEDAKGRR